MKSKKITQEQLRSLIMSEVKKTKLHEMPGRKKGMPSTNESVHSSIENAACAAFEGMYDPADPVMSGYEDGEAMWSAQCSEAAAALSEEIADVVEMITSKLVNGDFFRFSPNKGRLGR